MLTILLPFLINILVFGLILWAGFKNRYLMYGLLFFLFLWAFIALDLSTTQKVFYPLMLTFAIPMTYIMDIKTNAEKADLNGEEKGGIISGGKYHLFTIALGIIMLIIMFAMQASRTYSILGYPTLSVASSESTLTTLFSPTLSGALGVIENVGFITFFMLMILLIDSFSGIFAFISGLLASNPITAIFFAPLSMVLTILAPVIPVLLTMAGFGVFHIVSYALSIPAMLWAGFIFGMWIVSWYFTGKDTTAMDVNHYLWNGINTGRAAFAVAF